MTPPPRGRLTLPEAALCVLIPLAWWGSAESLPGWWPAGLAAALLLGRRLSEGSWSLPVLLAAAVGLTRLPDLLGVAVTFFPAAILGVAAHLAADRILSGHALGLLVVAAVWLLFPSAGGLAALLGTGLVLGASRPVLRGPSLHVARPALALLLGAALLLALFSAPLRRPALPMPGGGPAAQQAADPAPASTDPGARRPANDRAPPVRRTVTTAPDDLLPPWLGHLLGQSLMLSLMLATLALLALMLQLRRGGPRSPLQPETLLPVAALLLSVLMLLLYAGLSTPSGGAGAGGGASPETGLALEEGGTRTLPPLVRSISRALLLVGWLGSVITLVALAALVVYLLRRPAGGTDAARAVPERGPADAEKREVDPSAVRALYRSFLEVMRARGLERHPSDAPGDFARRAAERFPELAGAVNAITRAYLPVRYGGRPDLETFDQARAALAHIQETA